MMSEDQAENPKFCKWFSAQYVRHIVGLDSDGQGFAVSGQPTGINIIIQLNDVMKIRVEIEGLARRQHDPPTPPSQHNNPLKSTS